MVPQHMHVLGLLLTVCVATSVGQGNSSSPTNNTDVTPPPSNDGTKATGPQGKNPNFGFDCRRKADGCNGKPCNLETGHCSCSSGGLYSYNCADVSPDSITCNPTCVNGGACHAGKCVCTENFYGSNCNLTRAEVLCKGEQMFVNINPIGNFSGSIYVPGNKTCVFSSSNSAEAVDFTTELEKLPGLEGRWRVLKFNDVDCGNADVIITEQGTAYAIKIYVQYVPLFKSAVDQIVVAECLVTNGTVNVSSTDVSSVADVDTNLEQVNADGKLDAVTLRVLSSDQKSLAKTVTLGENIHLVFSMPVSNGSTFTDFRLQQCIANNTISPGLDEYKSLIFLQDGCPTQEARSIFAGLPKKTSTDTNTTTDVVLRAFVFVGSSQLLGFTCVVGLCSKDKPDDCAQPSCSDEASTAPPANSSAVRKREAGNEPKEATVGANTLQVLAPGQQETDSPNCTETDSPNNSGQVTSQDSTEPCSVYKFTVAVAILGVCVFLLLLLSACLIFQLMTSKKTDPERPDYYPRPVEGLRFPRMELNNAHDNAF